jgi:hypothetical protein
MSETVGQEELLRQLEEKTRVIRDFTRGVAKRYHNGFYLWGEGGISKSFIVEETLKNLGKRYQIRNSRITAKGLFELLRDHPDEMIVLEDVEPLFQERIAYGVLRAALWGQSGEDGVQERSVHWMIAGVREKVVFTGGILMTANCPLDDLPQGRALKTRLASVHFRPSDEELGALMRKLAARGYWLGTDYLSPQDCLEVVEEIIARSQRLDRRLDLRLMVNAFRDRLQFRNGDSDTDWQDLLESRMAGLVHSSGTYKTRSERKANDLAIVRQLKGLPRPERAEAWRKATGKSEKNFYHLLKQV